MRSSRALDVLITDVLFEESSKVSVSSTIIIRGGGMCINTFNIWLFLTAVLH